MPHEINIIRRGRKQLAIGHKAHLLWVL